MKRLFKGQQGFTLVEILIAIPIAALISTAATGLIFQILTSNRASSDMLAFRQVQTAGDWISGDALQAQYIDDTWDQPDDNGFPITLTWTDWDNSVHQVVYDLVAMPSGSLQQLQRQQTIDAASSTRIIAEHIDEDESQIVYTAAENNVALEVTVTIEGQTASRVYEITPRPLS